MNTRKAMTSSRHWRAKILAMAAVMGSVFAAAPSAASDWPKRAVTIVVPYGPGGHTDIMARLFAQKMTEKYNQPFIIENRGGASGTIGANVVAKSPPTAIRW